MAKLPRVTNKLYGSDIELDDIGQFGSAASGGHLNTKDIPTIQGLEAWSKGWRAASMSENKYPTRQERNGLDYAMSYQIDYMLREGIPEYDSRTEYSSGSVVKTLEEGRLALYQSLLDENIGQELANANAWEKVSFGGAFNLFDTKLIDHKLAFAESYGWALQGTYVYKAGVAGSRYGYPTFYAKCVEEKDLGVATETVLGENTITLYTNANGHIFYDIADKEAIDTWYNTYGIAWYYGVDTESERVFLPRTKWFIQPSGEITEVNSVNEAGLPNITGRYTNLTHNAPSSGGEIEGAFFAQASARKNTNLTNGTQSETLAGFGFDASLSNPIYGNSDTVQPPSINQLLYICVGNTNVESAVTDVVDVTTTENDTVPLFTGMYFDFTPNNVSWLKAGEQTNNEGIYRTCYNELVNILNGETKYGDLKVINVADMEVGVDYSEYWKVNQEDMTFITPTAISNKALSGGVMGNGMTLGLTDGTNNYGLFSTSGTTANSAYREFAYGTLTGDNVSSAGGSPTTNHTLGITTDSSKSGVIAEQSTSQLYFKVANAVQNLELLDAGYILENCTNKSMVDGQWIASELELSSAVAIGTYEIDLSSYLPNDTYNYEILVSHYQKSNANTGSRTEFWTDYFPNTISVAQTDINTVISSGTFIAVVGSGRTISKDISFAASTQNILKVHAYRRVGTNI